jgi:predicted transcriptional regulator
MTGQEFEQGMKHLGLSQVKMAEKLDVDRGTIAARCKAGVIDESFRYIMLGMLSEAAAKSLISVVEKASK